MSELAVLPSESSAAADRGSWADMAGMFASIACAIHCAAMPMVIGYLPLLGLQWLANESFHQVMAAVCFVLGLAAFVPGWRKHGSFVPTLIGLAGIGLLSFAAFGLEGPCCPSCAPSDANSDSAETLAPADASQFIIVTDGEQTADSPCDDESCQFCAHAAASAEASEDLPQAAIDGSAWMIPLMTPLGGCLLVAGHLINHRKSCNCQGDACCLTLGETEELA